jgi:hypothetical protein
VPLLVEDISVIVCMWSELVDLVEGLRDSEGGCW